MNGMASKAPYPLSTPNMTRRHFRLQFGGKVSYIRCIVLGWPWLGVIPITQNLADDREIGPRETMHTSRKGHPS
jgi:hypothetical protein